MISFNLCTFIGNIGLAPELKKTAEGSSFVRFHLAVDMRLGKDHSEPPMWLTVVAWRQLAEQVSLVVRKGSLVLVSGKLSIRHYTDKEQTERTSVEITAQTVQVLPTGTTKEKPADSLAVHRHA